MSTDLNNGYGLTLELVLPSQWSRIDRVSEAVAGFVAAVYAESDVHDALRMTCAELLENAIKYGTAGERIIVTTYDREDEIVVEVTNAIDDVAVERILQGHLDLLRSFPSSEAAYAAALERVAERADKGESSGLGFARIFYEGGCRLECRSPRHDRVTVCAHHTLLGKAPA